MVFFFFLNVLNDPNTVIVFSDDGFFNEDVTDALNALTVDLPTHWCACAPNGKYMLWLDRRLEQIPIEFIDMNRFGTWGNVVCLQCAQHGESQGWEILAVFGRLPSMAKFLKRFSNDYFRLWLAGILKDRTFDFRARGWLVGSYFNAHYQFSSLSSEDGVLKLVPFYEQTWQCAFSCLHGEVTAVGAETIAQAKRSGHSVAHCNLSIGGGCANRYSNHRFDLPNTGYSLHFEQSGLKTFLQMWRVLFWSRF